MHIDEEGVGFPLLVHTYEHEVLSAHREHLLLHRTS